MRSCSRLSVFGAFILTALLLAPAPASAQTATSFGVQGGLNVANVDFKPSSSEPEFNPDFKSRNRGVFGAFVAWDFNPNFGLQVDALYSQKGTKFDQREEFEGEVFDFHFEASVDYLEFPILLRANMPASDAVTFRVFSGPAFGFKVSDDVKATVNGEPDEEGLPEFKGQDVTWVVGGAVQFGQVFFDVRYSWGLTNIITDESRDEDEEVKTRTLGFMVGFRFR
jgi:hypothetical protein